ncbi:GntR family transcriptional regulator [uncultured Bifidobacterium sp.]|uniref:GntR family transcriptional regulator n=1 Tax=uncultured Bifidobacterium sp. TaxID=165187 RepID=UPI002613C1C9|nr:GntR family transcriptional regulator [uncultured Bifidobacterium sp.]
MSAFCGDAVVDGNDDVVRRLRAIISHEEYQPGERMGSERALAERLGVTRSRLRSALAVLERSHDIVRRIGRSGGIVVSDDKLERNINTVESLPDIARRQGLVMSSAVVSAVVTPASPADARMLRLPGNIRTVYAITRRRMIGDRPFSVESTHLPADMFPGFLSKDLTRPFYRIFEEDYGVRPQAVDETLDSFAVDVGRATLLCVPEGTSVTRIRRVAVDQSHRPCERAVDVYISSRIRFTMHHSGYVRLSATAGNEGAHGPIPA